MTLSQPPGSTPIMLAPMAGITDLPTRAMVQRFGADLVTSEMIACGDILTARPGTRAKAELGLAQTQTAVQLAGREARPMAEAARWLEGQGARTIDINMGCPAKKVVNGYAGSALMRAPDQALRIIEAVAGAVRIPVTLKMRLGWCGDSLNAPEIARRAEAAGIARIAVHGRTRCQFYKGRADWGAIRSVVGAVTIPVIANGDVVDTRTARAALAASGAAGLMVGRGAQGRPWLLAQIASGLAGRSFVPPRGRALLDLVQEHYAALLDFYGPELGSRVARKHLGWYMDTAQTPRGLRRQVLTSADPAAVHAALPEALCAAHAQAAAA